MPLPAIPAIMGAVKGAGGILSGLSLVDKIFLGLMAGQTLETILGGRAQMRGIESQAGLQKSQLNLAAAMGRKEEERTDKLIRRITAESDKNYYRQEKSRIRGEMRESESESNQMVMSMLMALADMNQQRAANLARPPRSTSSMVSYMMSR